MALEDKARGQRIAALRKQRHFTQQVMAEKLGIAYRTYQTWEAGEVMPEWANLEKLAKFFGVKPEDIIGEAPDLAALLGESNGEETQLDRMERILTLIAMAVGVNPAEIAAQAAEDAAQETAAKRNASSRTPDAKKKKKEGG